MAAKVHRYINNYYLIQFEIINLDTLLNGTFYKRRIRLISVSNWNKKNITKQRIQKVKILKFVLAVL